MKTLCFVPTQTSVVAETDPVGNAFITIRHCLYTGQWFAFHFQPNDAVAIIHMLTSAVISQSEVLQNDPDTRAKLEAVNRVLGIEQSTEPPDHGGWVVTGRDENTDSDGGGWDA